MKDAAKAAKQAIISRQHSNKEDASTTGDAHSTGSPEDTDGKDAAPASGVLADEDSSVPDADLADENIEVPVEAVLASEGAIAYGQHMHKRRTSSLKPENDIYRWAVGPKNYTTIKLNGTATTALLDTGAQVNLITPEYQQELGLPLLSMEEYVAESGFDFNLSGIGATIMRPQGYVKVRLQMGDYAEECIAFVLADATKTAQRVPFIVGTSTLKRMLGIQRESAPLDIVSRLTMGAIAYATEVDAVEQPNPLMAKTTKNVSIPRFSKTILKATLTSGDGMPTEPTLMAAMPTGKDSKYPLPRGLQILNATSLVKPSSRTIHIAVHNTTSETL